MKHNLSEYKILKKGQTGTGILIEQDAGFISPDEPRNKEFINEMQKLESGKPIITEPLVVYVVLQKYGVLNRNGRVYPEHILKKQTEIYQEAIKERRALGELEHPESSIIASDRVSHNILETWWEGKTLMGKMEILMTPGFVKYGIVSTKGDDVANLIRNKIKIGVSSRGVGSLKENKEGEQIVQDDFELICWDIVTAPSTPNAWILNSKEEKSRYVENTIVSKENINEKLIKGLDNFLLD